MTTQIGHLTLEQARAQLAPWPHRAAPISDAEHAQRLERARGLMRSQGVDALLVTAGTSLRWFAGVPWGGSERLVAMLLTLQGEPLMVCPVFEEGSLDAVLRIPAGKRLWEEHEDPHAWVAQAMAERGARTLALDPEAPYRVQVGLAAHLGAAAITSAAAIIDGCRMCKSPAELALMQQAKDITLEVHRRAARILSPGIRASEVKRFIDSAHRALAGTGSTFCAVQFGRATAFPHGLPGDQQLQAGELVLIDTGTTVDGYHSDITRTYAFGAVDAEIRSLWALEKEAQAAAFEAAVPGVPCEAVDAAARAVLEKAGLGPDYRLPGLPHRTGHGIGLAIHEPAYLVRGDRTPLAEGMCFSNEPMIVVPDRYGIRLEDHFHMTATGAKWFTEPQVSLERPFG